MDSWSHTEAVEMKSEQLKWNQKSKAACLFPVIDSLGSIESHWLGVTARILD